ncbi:MAG: phosphoglycerate dehydrogenase [Lachnospiraceae bacterium]|jgi:D-3-phosphoglycerate dehydrogenase|nr:phosphoglycerate dehydrogenase [Lachnospiraceae bacterium]
MKYNCLNAIAKIGLNEFGDAYEQTENFADADVALVRSAAMHEMEFGDKLLAVARAGAGVNNIPLDKLAEKGVVVFNTPGANANGVKELVMAGLLLTSRDILGGINWVQTIKDDENVAKLIEKGKGQFAGKEIQGKKLGVIGLGAIGVLVANAAAALGMTVYGCDPYISVENAWKLSRNVIHVNSREEIFQQCDYITVHVPLLDDTKKMINADTIAMMKDGVIILNFARDLLVDDDAMEAALASGKVAKYITDFPNAKTAGMKGVIAIPHLGASTQESEDNCAVMAVRELREYVEHGNIINSVNFPMLDAGVCRVASRICILHRNVPNMLSQFTTAVAGINIENMYNKSRGDFAYSVLDVCGKVDEAAIVAKLSALDGVLKVRVLQ